MCLLPGRPDLQMDSLSLLGRRKAAQTKGGLYRPVTVMERNAVLEYVVGQLSELAGQIGA